MTGRSWVCQAKEDAQAARTAAKTQTGLLKEKEVDLAAAQAVIWQKDDRISQLEQKEERWQVRYGGFHSSRISLLICKCHAMQCNHLHALISPMCCSTLAMVV